MALRRSLKLIDGRTIAWREYGERTALPVVFCHGNLNSSLFQPAWEKTEEETVAAGVRIIALDRPGYGDSSEHKGRSYKSFAQDVDCVLEKLQIGAFGVLGYSSGAPHALAIALESKRSPLALALVSSDAPYGELANKEAWAERMYGVKSSAELTEELSLVRSKASYEALLASYERMGKEHRREMAKADINHAVLHGFEGAASDSRLELEDGGWNSIKPYKREQRMCPVLMLHGSDDHDVPVEAARELAELLGVQLQVIEGENHSLIRRHWGKTILPGMIAAASKSQSTL